MKRIFALLIALLMVLSLAACGEEKRASKKDKDDKKETAVATVAPTESEPATDAPVNADENTIFSTADYALTVTDVNFEDSYYGIEILVKAENFTTDKEYTIMLENFTVNGLQAEGICYIEIGAGEVKNENASVAMDFLDMAGIETVEGFEATFYIIDEDYNTLETQTFTYGVNTQYTRDAQSTDVVLVDDKTAKITLVEKTWDEYAGYELILYAENFTTNELYLDIENVTINGEEYDAYLGTTIMPGFSTYDDCTFYGYELEEMGITSEADIKEIKFDLVVEDRDNFEDLSTTPVTVKP